jgi:cytochrome c-type biogenesis protein CcmH/NrfG
MFGSGKGEDLFFTRTMAAVLERQGHMEDALVIYKMLLDKDPEDEALRDKVERLKALAGRRRARKDFLTGR